MAEPAEVEEVLESRVYELEIGDKVVGHGAVVAIDDAGWAGWVRITYEDGTTTHSVTFNEVLRLYR